MLDIVDSAGVILKPAIQKPGHNKLFSERTGSPVATRSREGLRRRRRERSIIASENDKMAQDRLPPLGLLWQARR
jgi:hypothetical protein